MSWRTRGDIILQIINRAVSNVLFIVFNFFLAYIIVTEIEKSQEKRIRKRNFALVMIAMNLVLFYMLLNELP